VSRPETRDLSVGVNATGGFTVPQDFYQQLIEAQKWFGGMRASRATVLTTDNGELLPIAMEDDTSNVGVIVTENTAITAQDVAFTQTSLSQYMYTSKLVRVSYQLLQDSAFDIQSHLAKVLARRIGRGLNAHFTTGTGSGQPKGVVTGAASGKVGATGQTVSVIYDDLVDLVHSVDVAYRQQAQWMFNDSTLKALKKLKDSQNRPLWLPGLAVREPDTINGYPYVVNNDMAVMAANAKSILFGDFSNYYIRDITGAQLLRLEERYAEFLQVAFLAFERHDGTLVDAGQGPIKYYANSAT
jgi:HK97 family phage major capsid protein